MGVISGVFGESILLFHKSLLFLVPTLRGLLVRCAVKLIRLPIFLLAGLLDQACGVFLTFLMHLSVLLMQLIKTFPIFMFSWFSFNEVVDLSKKKKNLH